jgi:opacity protein-like surface antigen
MLKRSLFATAFFALAAAAPATAQVAQRLSVEPYVGYEFFGSLPDTNAKLEAAVSYGGRVGFQLSPQWSLFGNFQRSTPELTGTFLGIGDRSMNVDRWAAGVEFSYVPRGGAEGMLPIQIEAGLGQTMYEHWDNDLTVKLGLSSALQLSPNFAVRYGVDDHISNFQGDRGVVNQLQARIGAELRF